MTETTKEQRAAASLYIEKHTAEQATFPAHFIIALLSDSERLAAIEAVTLEDLPENVYLGDGRRADAVHDALLSLSAKVAEQAEEIERLRGALIQSGRNAGGFLRDTVSTDFLMNVPEEVRLVIERLKHDSRALDDEREARSAAESANRDCMLHFEEMRSEHDTLRRLLTETAVPLLEQAAGTFEVLRANADPFKAALSTIRAQMDGSPPRTDQAQTTQRCPMCDDTRVLNGHGGYDARCPMCEENDAEAGLAMLGGDGRV